MRMPEPNRETSAFLAMAQKLRHALTQRDKLIRPYRERYDRSEDDLRMMPESAPGSRQSSFELPIRPTTYTRTASRSPWRNIVS